HFRYERLRDVSDRLEEMFRANEAHLAACYWCPHHPRGTVASYASACECRKPAPALLQRAAGELGLDLRSSWFIGDILDDVEAGRRAGTRTILIDNGGETEWRQDSPCRIPERVVADLHAAALHIAACAQAELAT